MEEQGRLKNQNLKGAKGSRTALSELEWAIETVVKYYNEHAGKKFIVCGKEGIRKSGFKTMLQKDLNHMLTNTKNKEAVKKLFRDLDRDGDGLIDVNEYWDLIGNIVKPIAHDKQ